MRVRRPLTGRWACAVALVLIWGCGPRPGEPLCRTGDEIVAAGQLFHTGTPVVLWLDPQGYDAYRCRRHFEPAEIMPKTPADEGNPNRYGARGSLPDNLKARVDQHGWTLANLQQAVCQFVIHYDACGTSRRCFEVLHDLRGLSVHFMLDLDGTIYQTLDLKERAWHAGTANDRCIGIEIANIGAYANAQELDEWYALDQKGWPRAIFPSWFTDPGLRTPGFVARPARKDLVRGRINGCDLIQYDYTNEQYDALIKLVATAVRVLPNVRLQVPRAADGAVRADVLSAEELAGYAGLLGHQHVIASKVDPGPAFNWDRVIQGARRVRARGW